MNHIKQLIEWLQAQLEMNQRDTIFFILIAVIFIVLVLFICLKAFKTKPQSSPLLESKSEEEIEPKGTEPGESIGKNDQGDDVVQIKDIDRIIHLLETEYYKASFYFYSMAAGSKEIFVNVWDYDSYRIFADLGQNDTAWAQRSDNEIEIHVRSAHDIEIH